MPSSPATRWSAPLLAAGFLLTPFALWAGSPPAAAEEPQAHRDYTIPAGTLDRALNTFAGQAGILLVIDGTLTQGLNSAGLRGPHSVEAGFAALLRSSGLLAERQPDGSYVLRRVEGATLLSPVKVEGSAERPLTTEGSGSYTATAVSFGKGQQVREIPQSITVVTRQRIEDQGLTTVEDVLRQTTGVTLATSGTGLNGAASTIYSRGFEVTSMQIDGANVDRFSSSYFAPNLAMYDSVQVVRGADGLFGGTGSPGGSINLVRKRPTAETQIRVAATAGRWNHYSAEADVSGPLALYRIERKGEAVRDPDEPSTNVGDEGLNCCWLAQGEIVSEGVDLELSGRLADGWEVFTGYTYNRNENRRSDQTYSSITPKHLYKMWTTYRLPEQWSDWTLGAGVTAQSEHYVSGTAATYNAETDRYDGPGVAFDFTQAGYALWNASVQYRIQPGWDLAVNASNLFDKVYYKQLGNTGSGNWYGEPVNWTLSVRGRF